MKKKARSTPSTLDSRPRTPSLEITKNRAKPSSNANEKTKSSSCSITRLRTLYNSKLFDAPTSSLRSAVPIASLSNHTSLTLRSVPPSTLRHHVSVLRGPNGDVSDAEDAHHEVPQGLHAPGLNVLLVVFTGETFRSRAVIDLGSGFPRELGEFLELELTDAREKALGGHVARSTRREVRGGHTRQGLAESRRAIKTPRGVDGRERVMTTTMRIERLRFSFKCVALRRARDAARRS